LEKKFLSQNKVKAFTSSGIFFKIPNFDSPSIPPVSIDGLEALKKKNDLALIESQK